MTADSEQPSTNTRSARARIAARICAIAITALATAQARAQAQAPSSAHRLDPAHEGLSRSAVELPPAMNIYNGIVTTDGNGDASVQLPQDADALNRDFHYQLTVIGTFAESIVAEKVRNNHFRIKTNLPNVEVSWQVTGTRKQASASQHRIPAEADKPAKRTLTVQPPMAPGGLKVRQDQEPR